MSLRRCMEEHTERERDAWLYWIDEHWYDKSLTDFYLQQIAVEVRRSYFKNPRNVKSSDLDLKFERKKVVPVLSIEEKTARAQARWFAMTGFKKG